MMDVETADTKYARMRECDDGRWYEGERDETASAYDEITRSLLQHVTSRSYRVSPFSSDQLRSSAWQTTATAGIN